MSVNISRRTFLKCTGASVAAVGAAGMLGGCKAHTTDNETIVEVKVGDKVSNWNGLGVQLTSLYKLNATAPDGYEYIGVLVTAANRTKDQTFAIGAQNVLELNTAYPVPPVSNVDIYFKNLAESSTDFAASCDGQSAGCGAYISLYNRNSQSFSDSPTLPPQGVGYIELMLLVPTGWQQLEVTYLPTFAPDKTLTFIMTASDVTRG